MSELYMNNILLNAELMINKMMNNPIMIYSLVVTTIKTMRWYNAEKPENTRLMISYLFSTTSRYIFFPIYLISDSFEFSVDMHNYLMNNNIKLV